MNEHYTCRNNHRWSLSLEAAAINDRWVFCPACGAPPRPSTPLSSWKRARRWAQRNPAVLGLLVSMLALLATFALLATTQLRELRAQRERAQQEVEQALREAERLNHDDRLKAALEAAEAAARALDE